MHSYVPPFPTPLNPCTMVQVLIYEALGFQPPVFGHMSLILAPDKSKLSKRHGATSVGEFKQQVRSALLGWKLTFRSAGQMP